MPTPTGPDPRMDLYYAGPQTRVKIGRRRRLNLLIRGEGGPTVIFAPGMANTTLEWGLVQDVVARTRRTVSFDKAGMGFSDPGPMPRTASAVVEDLRAALKAADIAPPYVLAGWSAGGLYMQLFAFRYPDEVVGMVMVDSASQHQVRRMAEAIGDRQARSNSRKYLKTWTRLARLARDGALVPGTPDYDQHVGGPQPTLTPAVNAARHAQLTSPGFWRALRSEAAAFGAATSDQVTAARVPLGDMPIIVLTAGKDWPGDDPASAEARHRVWREQHDEIAALSTRGERRTIDAGHGIQVERPDIVVAAIEEVVSLARG
jgi:pimeloyl-ACP methyl ester carboxylesterase